MKTIRLLYPDYVSGGLDTYYFGANLLIHILPPNPAQALVKVDIAPPNGIEKTVTDGIYGKEIVLQGINDAMKKIKQYSPDKIITIGGSCIVSQASFDYLHAKYDNVGIIWLDAHPDVSTVSYGYPNAHAMVLGSLLGYGDSALSELMISPKFKPDEILYIGLQELHDYQRAFLSELGVNYKVQDQAFISDSEIQAFLNRFEHILVHFDIDVLDEKLFHSTYFANSELTGDGSGGGKMSLEKLSEILTFIDRHSDIVGFTIAEYLPFDEHKLHNVLAKISLFGE